MKYLIILSIMFLSACTKTQEEITKETETYQIGDCTVYFVQQNGRGYYLSPNCHISTK